MNKPGLGPPKIPSAKPASDEDDFDDFDPRGSSTAGERFSVMNWCLVGQVICWTFLQFQVKQLAMHLCKTNKKEDRLKKV